MSNMSTIVTMKTKNITENKQPSPQVPTSGLLAAGDSQGLAGEPPWHSWPPCTSTSSPGSQGLSCSRLAPGENHAQNNVEYENEENEEDLQELCPRLGLRSCYTWAELPGKELAGERTMESSGHQRGVHRGDEADEDVGEGDEDVEGGLHVAQELLRSVARSAREPAKIRVAGGDGDQLPVVVHADAAGQGLQPPDEIPSLLLEVSAGRLPAGQVEPTEGEGASGGSPQPRVELPQQVWHRRDTPPVPGASHGKGNLGVVLKDPHSRVCQSCWTNHHIVSQTRHLISKGLLYLQQ